MKDVFRCHFCKQHTNTPIHITEMNVDGSYSNYNMCLTCSEKFVGGKPKGESTKLLDITHIKTPEELLSFLLSRNQDNDVCDCGLSSQEFANHGKFGCPKCYQHFQKEIVKMVFPYHGGDHHVGKTPKNFLKRRLEGNKDEQIKLLKLQMAKAVELEQFEKASEIKKQIAILLD